MFRIPTARLGIASCALLTLAGQSIAQNQDGVSVGPNAPVPTAPPQVQEAVQGQALGGIQVGPVTPLPAQTSSIANLIDFDDVGAPCSFNQTTALREAYATLGVHFDGPALLDGGAILDQCGNFGVTGHSAPNFLAFNTGAMLSNGGIPRGPETITFDYPLTSVRLLAGSSAAGIITSNAFDANGALVATDSFAGASALSLRTLSGSGIRRVVISFTGSVCVVDDLAWSPEVLSKIDFDDATEPCVFASTTALDAKYAAQGVDFDGPSALDGGAILDECSNFGVTGHSSPNFLAFNTGSILMSGGVPKGPETIRFAFPVKFVQILAGQSSAGTIKMEAFNGAGISLGSTSITSASALAPMSISATGIRRVVVTFGGSLCILDDLSWQPERYGFIDFDDSVEPCVFGSTTALRTKYAALGVNFDGPALLDGGAILDECGNFGVTGQSSPNFLAFNTSAVLSNGGIPRGPETIRFDSEVSWVEILAGQSLAGTITMEGFDVGGSSLGSTSITGASALAPLTLRTVGIRRVVISFTGPLLVLDDLSWQTREPVIYCTAKPGLVCGLPAIGYSGYSSSSATSGFTILAKPARDNRSGLLLYTTAGRNNSPFLGGTLCVGLPVRRSVAVNSGGNLNQCDGVFALDMNSFASGNAGGNPAAFLLNVGTMVNVQWWGRDSIATGSFLSNALEYFVGP